MTVHLTPLLNDLAVSVAAPAILLSDPDGQVRRGGVRGWFVDDVRLLDELTVSVDGSDLELVRSAVVGADRQEFTHVARRLGGWIHDPTVTVDRRRTLTPAGLVEEIEVSSRGQEPVELALHVDLVADLAPMAAVRQGLPTEPVAAEETPDGLAWHHDGSGFAVALDPAPARREGDRLTWTATLAPGTSVVVRLGFTAEGEPAFGPGGTPPWSERTEVVAPDLRLSRLAAQSLADLGGLLMRDGDDAFVAAGSPWFLTLFGRDSLWVARLLMPYGTGLAMSTLRTLARRQGERLDADSEEQPGKILHEVRNTTLGLGGMCLPPVYYGTVDATPLFVCTLADAWRWGADRDEVAALLPAVRRCLAWVVEQSRESGWLRYVDLSGHGLANQGWKDSVDAVRFADGRLGGPADRALRGAGLRLRGRRARGRAAGGLRRGAGGRAGRLGRRPARALRAASSGWTPRPAVTWRSRWTGTARPVDSVTSNMGHLLGTGILTEDRVARVVEVLTGPDMASGFGLRTLTDASPRYSRLSYHGGSVWPHDTAVAVRGLALEGRLEEAAQLTAGLVAAAEGVAYRLPELYGGDPRPASRGALPGDYPACLPPAGLGRRRPAGLPGRRDRARRRRPRRARDHPPGLHQHPARHVRGAGHPGRGGDVVGARRRVRSGRGGPALTT